MAEALHERTVVVAMDGSHFAAYAFEWYMENAHRKTDHVIFVHTPEFQNAFTTSSNTEFVDPTSNLVMDMYRAEEKKARELIQSLRQRLKDAGVSGKVRCESGFPGHAIVKVAEEEKAAFIVTGCRGQGTVRRTLMGSVSDYIVHHSHVPVVVCRHKGHYTKHDFHSHHKQK
ncbi:universal stress protein YxiE-like [Haliotis cracherodii]|uniref:universal stress protein YxiE-like n=1 Tax=Haliotis cracherodii TaxID=6455 RepID=UPI0039EA6218